MYFLFLKNLVRFFKWFFNLVANIQIYVVIQQRLHLCSEYCYLVSGEVDVSPAPVMDVYEIT